MSAGLMLRGLHEGRNVLLVMRVRLKVRGGQMEMQHGFIVTGVSTSRKRDSNFLRIIQLVNEHIHITSMLSVPTNLNLQ